MFNDGGKESSANTFASVSTILNSIWAGESPEKAGPEISPSGETNSYKSTAGTARPSIEPEALLTTEIELFSEAQVERPTEMLSWVD